MVCGCPLLFGFDDCKREAGLSGEKRDCRHHLCDDRWATPVGKPAPTREKRRQHIALERMASMIVRQ